MNQNVLSTCALSVGLILSACSDSPSDDVHSAPRDNKAWESVDVSGFDQGQLVGHLNVLASEAVSAAAAGESIEFHHLEVAMTPTLTALEARTAGNEKASETIATLKDLAVKFHLAGHDGKVKAGVKLGAAISELSARLATEL